MLALALICRCLEDLGIPSPGGKEKWSKTTVTSILQNEKYKGDALLQKSFTVDFLEKRMKPIEGEVPQYYVEGNHPAIVDPDEWDHVQTEFARRKALGRAYSGKSVLSAKLALDLTIDTRCIFALAGALKRIRWAYKVLHQPSITHF